MNRSSPFIRYLLGNLRTSALAVGVGIVVLVVYGESTAQEPQWWLLGVVVVAMTLSSLLNALYDSYRRRKKGTGGGGRA